MNDRLGQCSFPRLDEPYASALEEATRFVLSEVDPIGIVAAGTIVRGVPHRSSDLDLYVVHERPFRRRIQRFFGNQVPTEVFINPPSSIRSYFIEEHEDGRPRTAHMLATGQVLFQHGSELDSLVDEARSWLERPSFLREPAAIRAKYFAATAFEDASDVMPGDPVTASMLVGVAVVDMLETWCRAKTGRLPRRKDLLARVAELDPTLGALARRLFGDPSVVERLAAAEEIADRTLGVRGFFEWDSGPEPLGE